MRLLATELREFADAMDAFHAGIPVEKFIGGKWVPENTRPTEWGTAYPRRPAKAFTQQPWSFADHPPGVVWVTRKDLNAVLHGMITAWCDDCVTVGTKHGGLRVTYADLLIAWKQIDGKLCGTLARSSEPPED